MTDIEYQKPEEIKAFRKVAEYYISRDQYHIRHIIPHYIKYSFAVSIMKIRKQNKIQPFWQG